MKTFKIIDLVIQGLFLLIAIVFGITNESINWVLYFYFGVGSWQLISFSFHYFFIPPTIFQQDRNFYGKLVLVTLVLGMLFFIPVLFEVYVMIVLLYIYLFGLLILSPILAIFYFVICWKEYRLIVRRELLRFK